MIRYPTFFILYFLMGATWLYLHFHSDILLPAKRPFHEFPVRNHEWVMASQSVFSEEVLGILNPTDYLSRYYVHPQGGGVSLYIGYHNAGGVHSPRHCLPGGGWHKVAEREMDMTVKGKTLHFVRAVYRKDGESELFLYWYRVKGKTLSDEYVLKAYEILNSLLYRRRDLAFIRISLPVAGDEKRAFSVAERFIRDFYPVIEEFLPE